MNILQFHTVIVREVDQDIINAIERQEKVGNMILYICRFHHNALILNPFETLC